MLTKVFLECPMCSFGCDSITSMGWHIKTKHPEIYQEFKEDCMTAVQVKEIKF